ncbi:MAG: hypothetical protein P4L58_03360 [Candidatus Pacebacteria bacterium]|nr:hypothetical protein [Candidatus Paceibacterota bacterium]
MDKFNQIRAKDRPSPGFPEMGVKIFHTGAGMSYELMAINGGKTLMLIFPNGDKKFIPIQGDSRAKTFCPSYEGGVILVYTSDGGEHRYDVASGELIDEVFMEKVRRGERILGKVSFHW